MPSDRAAEAAAGLSDLPQEGLWRVTALLRRRPELDSALADTRIAETLVPAVAAALAGEDRLVRLVADRRPRVLDGDVAALFPPLFDAMIELWLAKPEDAAAVVARLDADREVVAAAAGAIDLDTCLLWLAQVFPIKPERGASRIKFLAGGDAAEGCTIEEAQAYWRDVHPEVAKTAPSVWEPLTRYVQFHGGPAPAAGRSALGTWRRVPLCSEMGFADERAFLATYSGEEYGCIVRPDEEKFSRPGEMLAFVSGEERVVLARE